MNFDLSPYLLYLASFAASLLISVYSVKKILFITTRRKIYDIPDKIRKIHGDGIPSLGGIGIFTGYLVAAAFFMYQKNWNFAIASSMILFFTGIYDDLANMRPTKKLLAQLIASFIAVHFADIRIYSFYGAFGINELPYWISIAFTTLACTLFINVFNFVDGIDGLAGYTAVIYLLLLAGLFAAMSDTSLACISLSLAGATIGLLIYNTAPAKIYMGDTGSMVLGFTIFLLVLLFGQSYSEPGGVQLAGIIHSPQGAFLLSVAILFYPVYDGVRVFILRISKGISPFNADRTHLHYYMLDAGISHPAAVALISAANILIIFLAWLLQDQNAIIGILAFALVETILLAAIYRLRQSKLKQTLQ